MEDECRQADRPKVPGSISGMRGGRGAAQACPVTMVGHGPVGQAPI